MKINLLKDFKKVAADNGRDLTMQDLVEAARDGEIGKLVWDKCHDRRKMVEMCASWPGWPTCQCTCCGCDEAAVTTDDCGVEVCDECAGLGDGAQRERERQG